MDEAFVPETRGDPKEEARAKKSGMIILFPISLISFFTFSHSKAKIMIFSV